ncbi:MAG: FAD-dependent oxidoreductase [Clostridia bacterium]|nr:FAD-dependent oxidoreductase [Clostridia bacterium]
MQHFDLIVIGGGQAGCSAALSAARQGVSVLLCEASGALGGAANVALVNPYMKYATYVEANGEQKRVELCAGIFREIHEALENDEVYGYTGKGTSFHEETMKVIFDRKMQEAGVTVLFHAKLCGVEREGRLIKSVTFATVGGNLTFTADSYIDATGDAIAIDLAGSLYHVGREGDNLCQPMTLCFRLGNVDVELYDKTRGRIDPVYRKLQAEGKLKNPREDVLIFHTRIPGVLHFNTTRIVKLDPTNPFDRSRAEMMAREQVVEMFHFLRDNFEAFRNADLLFTAAEIGVRESRMIDARHILTAEDLIAGTKFPDAIAAGNYDMDIHSPDGTGTSHHWFPEGFWYTIPYRSLLPRDLDNMAVAGRSVGSTHEAQAAIRIMPICSCMGEAAGMAAAIAREDGVCIADVDTDKLRARLVAVGAFVG